MQIKLEAVGKDARINIQGWSNVYTKFVDDTANEIQRLFEQSFAGFHNHNPGVTRKGTAAYGGRGNIEVVVGVLEASPDNNIYAYVNWGTNPRIIAAKSPRKPLRFKAKYTPATVRGTLAGGQWAKTGPWIVTYFVKHPGISPRRFDVVIHLLVSEYVKQESGKRLRAQRGKTWKK